MDSYKIVRPEDFTNEHIEFIRKFKELIQLLSTQTCDLIGMKDADSRCIIGTDHLAKIFGYCKGSEMEGTFDFEMPCFGTAQYAETFVKEDQALIQSLNPNKSLSVLSIHNYADGLKARAVKKHVLHHKESASILGVIYSGYTVELDAFLNIFPNYFIQVGQLGSFKATNGNYAIADDIHLNEYEQEVCFLILFNWSFRQIAEFMNMFRPGDTVRTADTISKKKDYICHKLHLPGTNLKTLCEYLFSIGFHESIPNSFYSKIMGSKVLKEHTIF